MNIHSFVAALVFGAPLLQSSAHALPVTDPRTPINAVETPGDADSVFRISQSGSYYLEANLDGVAGKSGIEIAASNVRIDLMGFHLQGVEGSSSAIRVPDVRFSLSIVNGTISSWDSHGVDGLLAQNTRVRDLEMFNCEAGGIRLDILANVENCTVFLSSGPGIVVGRNSIVSRCAIVDTSDGISAGRASLVEDCTVDDISDRGIEVDIHSTVRGSVARFCSGGAIVLGSDSSVISSTAFRSTVGIFGLGSLRVIDCTLEDNLSDGVRLASGLVRGCTITRNDHYGIEVTSSAHVVGNFISSNGLDGIRSLAGSRIEDNDIRGHVTGAGIRTQGTGSYIVKNTLTQNASTVVAPNSGNFVGTLVPTNGINGRNDPWANLYSN